MNLYKVFVFGCILLSLLSLSLADEILTNETIIRLVESGLGEELILNKIKATPCRFDVSTDGLLMMQQKGVSENILNAMIKVSSEKETLMLKAAEKIRPSDKIFSLRIEIEDRTAGQSLSRKHIDEIKSEITRQMNNKYPAVNIAGGENEAGDATIRVIVEVFTAGNRALRFWVGFGAGKAHLRMNLEYLEGNPPQFVGSKTYQRFGAASLKTGQEIENYMAELIAQYSLEFLSGYL